MPRVLVVAAKRNDYVSKKSGARVQFLNVWLVMGEIKNTPEEKGMEVVSMDAPFSAWLDLEVLPGFYDAEFTVKKGWNGEVEPAIARLALVEPMNLTADGVQTVVRPAGK